VALDEAREALRVEGIFSEIDRVVVQALWYGVFFCDHVVFL
jgi:hypothetical protein